MEQVNREQLIEEGLIDKDEYQCHRCRSWFHRKDLSEVELTIGLMKTTALVCSKCHTK